MLKPYKNYLFFDMLFLIVFVSLFFNTLYLIYAILAGVSFSFACHDYSRVKEITNGT